MIKEITAAKHFYTLATLMLVVIAMYFLKPVLAPLCISFIIAVTLMPATRFLERKGMATPWAALAVVIGASIFLVAVAFSVTWQVSHLMESSPGLTSKVETKIYGTFKSLEQQFPQLGQMKLSAQYRQKMNESLNNRGAYITSALGDFLPFVGNALLMPLYVYFMLSYRHFFRKFFHRTIDKENEHIDEVLFKAHDVTQDYLSGLFTVMVIVAVLNFIGLTIFKVPYALFFAVLASVLMVIPYVGVFIGSLLPTLFALITNDSTMVALGVAAWMWVVQLLEGNFITPNLVGSKVSINPFIAMVFLLLMSQLWGMAGMVLAIPMVAVLKVVLDASPSTEPYGMLLGDVDHDLDEEHEQPQEEEKPAKKAGLSKRIKKAISA